MNGKSETAAEVLAEMFKHFPKSDVHHYAGRIERALFAPPDSELAQRLLAHADAHTNVSPHDDEQAQWERDLREAARLLSGQREAVAWEVWHAVDGWGPTSRMNVDDYRKKGIPVRPLYTHPAPSLVASDEVLIAITRGEGYEDVHPQMVAEDALRQTLHGGCQFEWRVVTHPAPARVTEERIAKLEAEILALRVAAQPFVRYNSSEKTTSIRVNSEDIKALRFALSNAPAISVTEDIVERFCAATFVGWAKIPEEKKSIFREKERVSLTAALEADHGN